MRPAGRREHRPGGPLADQRGAGRARPLRSPYVLIGLIGDALPTFTLSVTGLDVDTSVEVGLTGVISVRPVGGLSPRMYAATSGLRR